MATQYHDGLSEFLDILGLTEEPVGIFYTDNKPANGSTPKPMPLPTREKEIENDIDWQAIFGQFSCVMGQVLQARKLNGATRPGHGKRKGEQAISRSF